MDLWRYKFTFIWSEIITKPHKKDVIMYFASIAPAFPIRRKTTLSVYDKDRAVVVSLTTGASMAVFTKALTLSYGFRYVIERTDLHSGNAL